MMNRIFLNLFVCLCSVTLMACGGSSGGDGDSPPRSSSSSSASSSSQPTAFGAPQNLAATPGNSTVRLNWNAVSSADSYHVYYATEPGIQPNNIAAFDNGTWIEDV